MTISPAEQPTLPSMPGEALLTEEQVRGALEELSSDQLVELIRALGHRVESGEVPTDSFMDEMDLALSVLADKAREAQPSPPLQIDMSPKILFQGSAVKHDK